jgi:hypothetical protein
VTCQTITNDPTLEATQKFDEYSKIYRLMTEPITQTTHSSDKSLALGGPPGVPPNRTMFPAD